MEPWDDVIRRRDAVDAAEAALAQIRDEYGDELRDHQARYELETQRLRQHHAAQLADLSRQHQMEVCKQRALRWRDVDRLLDRINPPLIMIKVLPHTEAQIRTKVPRLENWTYGFDTVTFTKDRPNVYGTGKALQERKTFTCDQVFCSSDNAHQSNARLFDELSHMYMSAVTGRNIALIAFGATATGKSSTLFRSPVPADPSVLSRALSDLYDAQCTVEIAATEDYMGQVVDMLAGHDQQRQRADGSHGVPLTTTCQHCPTLEDALDILTSMRRKTSKTTKNDVSSRSHAIINVQVLSREGERRGRLSFVDLAGREHLTSATQKQRAEGHYIEHSIRHLTTLLLCVAESDRARGAGSQGLSPTARAASHACTLTKLLAQTLTSKPGSPLACIILVGFIAEHGASDTENLSTCRFIHQLHSRVQSVRLAGRPGKLSDTERSLESLAQRVTVENGRLRALLRDHGIKDDQLMGEDCVEDGVE